jgi:hypothetical protein
MIYNVIPGTFNNYGIRNGDMIAIINFLQWFRMQEDDPTIKLHIKSNVIVKTDYCKQFYKLLCELTDCFSLTEGYQNLPYHELMLWDFRDICGDVVSIHNPHIQKKKIVVFPVYDSDYHVYRNWNISLLESILEEYTEKYPDYEKLLCVKDLPDLDIKMSGFSISTHFMQNIKHIMEAEIFIGGDTGVSHFASALNLGPKELVYCYNGRSTVHTLPFHLLSGKGTLRKYWLNCYKTTYKGQLVL